jgi:hypothetical protein
MEVQLHSFLTSALDGFKESSAFIFKRQTVLLGVLDPGYKGTTILRNGADCSLNDTASHPKRKRIFSNSAVTASNIAAVQIITLLINLLKPSGNFT